MRRDETRTRVSRCANTVEPCGTADGAGSEVDDDEIKLESEALSSIGMIRHDMWGCLKQRALVRSTEVLEQIVYPRIVYSRRSGAAGICDVDLNVTLWTLEA